jgi:hypothetical protein
MIACKSPYNFVIGKGSWEQEIRYFTHDLDKGFWLDFHPVSTSEVARIETETNRKLPGDFKEFLRVFGCGGFPLKFGGDISNPEELILGCHHHLWMVLGSADWVGAEEQLGFYVTRGTYNPNPAKYTGDALFFDDLNLLDLFQIGTNGMGCYHQIYVGEKQSNFGYGLLTPEITMEDASSSFSEGLRRILTHYWCWDKEPE